MLRRCSRVLAAIGFALVCYSSPTVAQQRSDRLAVSDIFDMEIATDPQISPDGEKIIYVRQFSDIMTDKRYSNLWIINFDGTNNRPLTTGNFNDTSPRWSSDGTRIIYVSDRSGSPQIFERWMDTGQTAKLTNLQTPPSGINFSPDGRLISFTAAVPAPPANIGTMPAAPPGAKWAEPATVTDRLVYRFNDIGYLKPGFRHVFILPAEGGTPRQLSSGNFNHGQGGFGPQDPVWTPDSKYLLLTANRRPDYEYEQFDTEIYELSIAEGTIKALTNRRGPDHSPAISPDGKYIAYLGYDDKYQGYQVTKLYVMNRDGTSPHVLPKESYGDRDYSTPRWLSDNTGIFVLHDDRGRTQIDFCNLQGEMRLLADDVGAGASAYSFGASYSVSRNSRLAFTYTDSRLPGDIAAASIAGKPQSRVITAVNADVLGAKKLGEVEEFWYNSSLDQRKIQGWIIKPPGFESTKKYPLILEIHGGPFANYGPRFDMEKQLMAARGYVVIYVNPRGSTSYGEEFGNLIHYKYPGDDFYDLNSGVDAAIAKLGNIDTDNLFVTGGSGGGVLTCWVIGHTNRFRAAVTVYPVINWYSFVLTSDIPILVSRYWFPGLPWDNVEHYEKRSLLSVVKNVKTPTMVLTGEEDYRTPISESEQYYTALKLLKIETVLVRVPGEPHGIARRPSHHAAKISYIINWFDQHRGRS
ncbi:MAG TPA: S9 family peptidase [Blastocatellia bacterium]|nr:S9 family peptidase [Blastocatellia bacterium]